MMGRGTDNRPDLKHRPIPLIAVVNTGGGALRDNKKKLIVVINWLTNLLIILSILAILFCALLLEKNDTHIEVLIFICLYCRYTYIAGLFNTQTSRLH